MSQFHLLGPDGEPTPQKSWMKEQLTLPNLVIVCSVAFGVGGYIKQFDALEQRVVNVEQSLKAQQIAADETYERQDVNQKVLGRIEEQLVDIKADLRELKSRR